MTNLAIMIGLGAVFLAWVAAFKLEVAEGVLSYRTLFKGTRSIALCDIQKAETATGLSGPLRPFFRLTIQAANTSERPLVINMKVFSKSDIDELLRIMGPKLKGVRRLSVLDSRNE